MAQNNVYSLNVVGYINVALPTGYSLVANQLAGSPDNTLNSVFGTNLPEGIQAIKWNPATQSFNPADTLYSAATAGTAGWYGGVNGTTPSTTTAAPGETVFILNQNPTTNVTFVGQVIQGTNAITLATGYSFLSLIPPIVADVGTNGPLALPPSPGMQYLTFNQGKQAYNQAYTYYDTSIAPVAGWYDDGSGPGENGNPQLVPLLLTVGQGFLVLNQGTPLTWTNTFSVQ